MSPDLRAEVAITALGRNELSSYAGIKLKLRYGVSLHRDAIHHNRAMTHGFDGMLAHGAFERDLFSRWMDPARIKIMGFPRHDALFRDPRTREAARETLGLVQGTSRVLAYLPTWSLQSSLHTFVEPLERLARSQVLLVKPHALSLLDRQERAALDRLHAAGARPVADATSIATVLTAADVAITDATSGATPEAVLLATATPLLLLTARGL
jgi:CDP-glycerol glycerophosphotransferase (TagB/SpsB family)